MEQENFDNMSRRNLLETMTPEQIKQLTPEQYGGDFELTMEAGEK